MCLREREMGRCVGSRRERECLRERDGKMCRE